MPVAGWISDPSRSWEVVAQGSWYLKRASLLSRWRLLAAFCLFEDSFKSDADFHATRFVRKIVTEAEPPPGLRRWPTSKFWNLEVDRARHECVLTRRVHTQAEDLVVAIRRAHDPGWLGPSRLAGTGEVLPQGFDGDGSDDEV